MSRIPFLAVLTGFMKLGPDCGQGLVWSGMLIDRHRLLCNTPHRPTVRNLYNSFIIDV